MELTLQCKQNHMNQLPDIIDLPNECIDSTVVNKCNSELIDFVSEKKIKIEIEGKIFKEFVFQTPNGRLLIEMSWGQYGNYMRKFLCMRGGIKKKNQLIKGFWKDLLKNQGEQILPFLSLTRMSALKMMCVNTHGLGSAWKQGHYVNDLRSPDLDVAAISGTRIPGKQALVSIFKDNDVFPICSLSGVSGNIAVLLQKSLNHQVRTIFLHPGGRVVVLSVNGSEK